MIWDKPGIGLASLECVNGPALQRNDGTRRFALRAEGVGFSGETPTLVLVYANPHGPELLPWQVIPGENVRVSPSGGGQIIDFDVSLYQRQDGPYHLVGWMPSTQSTTPDGTTIFQNNATVLENALTVIRGSAVVPDPVDPNSSQ